MVVKMLVGAKVGTSGTRLARHPHSSNNPMEQHQNQQHLSNPFGDAPANSMPGMVNAYGQHQPNGNM